MSSNDWRCSCEAGKTWTTWVACPGCGKSRRHTRDATAIGGGSSWEGRRLRAELAHTRRQLTAARAAATATPAKGGMEQGRSGTAAEDLAAAHAGMERKFGAGHAITLAAAASLEEAKAEQARDVATAARARDAERAVERELEVQRAAERAADAARESYAKAEANLEAALRHYEEAEQFLEVQQALEEEGGGPAEGEQITPAAQAQGGLDSGDAQTREEQQRGEGIQGHAQRGGEGCGQSLRGGTRPADGGNTSGRTPGEGAPRATDTGQTSAGAEVDFSSLSEQGRRLFAEATARCDLATAEGQKRTWAAVRRLQGGDPKRARQAACPPARSQPR